MSYRVPKYGHHKPSGNARVIIDGRHIYLGPHGSDESKARYRLEVEKWRARQRHAVPLMTVGSLTLLYFDFARQHYRKGGQPTTEVQLIQTALRFVNQLHRDTQILDFGPKALKQVRDAMVSTPVTVKDKHGRVRKSRLRSRKSINASIRRIVRMFSWAVEEEFCPAETVLRLKQVRPLARGRSAAAETSPIRPVEMLMVEAVKPHVSETVWAMIQVQLLTGMRPGEVCVVRGCDIDRSKPVWVFRPEQHKTEHFGHQRLVLIGPKAQRIMAPFIDSEPPDGYVFCPKKVNGRNNARRGARYLRTSYTRAVTRACTAAGIDRWTPNQLRHTAATLFRQAGGLEAAQPILGHTDSRTTEIYAETDIHAAEAVIAEIG